MLKYELIKDTYSKSTTYYERDAWIMYIDIFDMLAHYRNILKFQKDKLEIKNLPIFVRNRLLEYGIINKLENTYFLSETGKKILKNILQNPADK